MPALVIRDGALFRRGFSARSSSSRYVVATAACNRMAARLEALALADQEPPRRLPLANTHQSLLEHSGIPSGYAFDILSHADEIMDRFGEGEVERRGKSFAACLHELCIPVPDVPKVMACAGLESGTGKMNELVEFLKDIGVRGQSVAAVMVAYPEILRREIDELSVTVQFLSWLGFTAELTGSLVTRAPLILSKSVDGLAQLVEYMTLSLGFGRKDVRRLVTRYPWVLVDDDKLKKLVLYLEEIGVRRNNMGRVISGKLSLLDTNIGDLAPMVEFLRSINASADDIDKILSLYPGLLGCNPQVLSPVVTYLENLGVSPLLMGKLLRRHPRLFTAKFHIEQNVEFLLSLGIERKDLGKVLFRAPQLMSLNIEDNMKPTLLFLASVGVNPVKVLKSKPMILGYNVESKIRANLEFVQSLGLDSDSVGKLLSRCPHLLTLSVDKNLQPTVCYFLELGFEREEVAEMVKRLPSLLGFSVSTLLAPKYEFFRNVLRRSRSELVHFPQYFSYSLDTRLKPRFERLGEHFQKHGLGSVYSPSDASFETRYLRWTQTGSKPAESNTSATENNGWRKKARRKRGRPCEVSQGEEWSTHPINISL